MTITTIIANQNGLSYQRLMTRLTDAATSASINAEATAEDRIQTGLDAEATAADRVGISEAVEATAADRAQTALDAEATAADRAQTTLDAEATAEDRIQTALDAETTTADRVSAASSALTASLAAANAQASALTCATWDVLSDLTGATAGTGAEVLDDDTGTHTDPVVGGTVANAGRYTWSASPAGWKWISVNVINERVPLLAVGDRFLPIVTAGRQVPVWLEDGKLAFHGMTEDAKTIATSGVIEAYTLSGVPFPILMAGTSVIMWADAEKVYFPPMEAAISDAVGVLQPRGAPVSATRPIATDGRSLHAMRAQLAKLKNGSGGKLKVAITGDSWGDRLYMPRGLLDFFAADLTTDLVWQSATGEYPMDVTYTLANWTSVDGSSAPTTYGTRAPGPDGNLIYAFSATVATLTYIAAQAYTNLKIYSRKLGGVWRYRIDGGSWTTVTETTGNTLTTTTISGLANTTHTLEIDTTGNAATVALNGFYTSRPAVDGVDLIKIGNSGTTGRAISTYAPYMQPFIADLAPDVVIIFLGTNDYRTSNSTLATFMQGIEDLRDAWRAAVPDIGFIFVGPAQSSAVAVTPLSSLIDSLYLWCIAEGHEFYSMFDDWGSYADESARGMWNDVLHPSYDGGVRVVARLDQFFNLKG